MAILGCLYHCTKALYHRVNGNMMENLVELDKAEKALRKPPFSDLGDFLD